MSTIAIGPLRMLDMDVLASTTAGANVSSLFGANASIASARQQRAWELAQNGTSVCFGRGVSYVFCYFQTCILCK
jgi:hypothetical protein